MTTARRAETNMVHAGQDMHSPADGMEEPPAYEPPAYAVVDQVQTSYSIYGTFIHTPTAPAYQLSSLLDARISKLRIRRLRPEEMTQFHTNISNIAFDSSSVLYEAHNPPFLVNEFYIYGKQANCLAGVLQMKLGMRRWHIRHIPPQGTRPRAFLTCEKTGGLPRALMQRRNETASSQWKDSQGRVLATEVLKITDDRKMVPTIELSGDLNQMLRELILALWVARSWAAFSAR